MTIPQESLFERILGLAVVALLAAACLVIVSPFAGAILWAAVLVTTGLVLVLVGPVAAWLFYRDQQAWAIFTVAWGVFINLIDNFIKPYLISQGSGLPLALIFLGVIGGMLAWGVIGIFLGPTLLATGFTLFKNWLEQGESA